MIMLGLMKSNLVILNSAIAELKMTATFSKEFINDFIGYVMSFYGPGELYPIKGINRTIVRKATNDIIKICKVKGEKFCGDSYDREQVRDLLIDKYNLQTIK
jgi:hypothetical protein